MKYAIALITMFAALNAWGADLNGYTARYEKKIGTPPACSAVINSVNDADWAKLNDPSYRVICIEPGDYSSKGPITLAASGSAGNERWLRYYRPDDNGDHPVKQAPANRAKLKGIILDRAQYWIIHRITVDGNGQDWSSTTMIEFLETTVAGNADNNIVDSVLAENARFNMVTIGAGNDDNTIQNSVLRNCIPNLNNDWNSIGLFGGPKRNHIVNNEMYNCTHLFYISEHSAQGTVVENNDMYTATDQYTDCNGNFNGTGPCATSEDLIGTKNGGDASGPVIMIHNRVWGSRKSDQNFTAAGGDGFLAIFANAPELPIGGAKYIEFRNNILFDGQLGVGDYWPNVSRNSIVGNIIYKIKPYHSATPSYAFSTNFQSNTEWYLNTVIDANSWFSFGGGVSNDIRCNVVINSGAVGGTADNDTQVNFNAFYNTTPYTRGSPGTNVIYAAATDAKHVDYCFWRKLRTGAESVCIPNAKPTSASPHRNSCDSSIGTRLNIGVSDQPLL